MCRFAFTVIWEMTHDAEIVNTSFMKSVILSKVRASDTHLKELVLVSNFCSHRFRFKFAFPVKFLTFFPHFSRWIIKNIFPHCSSSKPCLFLLCGFHLKMFLYNIIFFWFFSRRRWHTVRPRWLSMTQNGKTTLRSAYGASTNWPRFSNRNALIKGKYTSQKALVSFKEWFLFWCGSCRLDVHARAGKSIKRASQSTFFY